MCGNRRKKWSGPRRWRRRARVASVSGLGEARRASTNSDAATSSRWATAGGGRLRIVCTGKGMAFVAVSVDHFLADSGLLDPPSSAPLLDKLAVGLGAEGFHCCSCRSWSSPGGGGGFFIAVMRNRNHTVDFSASLKHILLNFFNGLAMPAHVPAPTPPFLRCYSVVPSLQQI